MHGNEPSSREACLIMARELAFADDPRTLDILASTTVLIVPTINGDGRAANTRGNATGQDLNRDYSLIREPETFAFVEMMRDYDPEAAFDGHEFGNNQAGDLPVLPPRHLNVARSIFDQSKSMIEDWLYARGSDDGWWYCPYGCQSGGAVGLSQETILRNTMGLKSVVGSLLEARSAGGATRPNESNAPNNRRRKTYSAIYTYQQFLDYQLANQAAIAQAIEESIAFQTSNTGRIVFRGSYPIPAFPAPHPGESPPPDEDPTPEQILDPPPCGYVLSEQQYSGPQPDGRPVGERLAAHGLKVAHRNGAPRLLGADGPAAARADPAAPGRAGRRADGRRGTAGRLLGGGPHPCVSRVCSSHSPRQRHSSAAYQRLHTSGAVPAHPPRSGRAARPHRSRPSRRRRRSTPCDAAGNAIDAAVAAAAVLGVTEPFSCGIGGGGFMVIRTAGGDVTTIDGRETAPAAMHPTSFWENGAPLPFNDARYSGLSVGVPGTVETWEEALEKFGTMSLARGLRSRRSTSRATATSSTRSGSTRRTRTATGSTTSRRAPRSSSTRTERRATSARCSRNPALAQA